MSKQTTVTYEQIINSLGDEIGILSVQVVNNKLIIAALSNQIKELNEENDNLRTNNLKDKETIEQLREYINKINTELTNLKTKKRSNLKK